MPDGARVSEFVLSVSIGAGAGHAIVDGHLCLAAGWIAFGYLVLELTAPKIPAEEPCSHKKRRSARTQSKLTKKKTPLMTGVVITAQDSRPPFFPTSSVANVLSSTEFEENEFPWTVVRGRRHRRRWYSDC